MGFFKQLKEAWLASVTFDKLDDEFYDQLEEALILADMGVESATDAVAKLRKKVKERLLTRADEVKDALRAILAEKLEVGDAALNLSTTPSIVLFIGVNGVGKTTSIGKLAAQLKAEGKKVLLCAGDTLDVYKRQGHLPAYDRRPGRHAAGERQRRIRLCGAGRRPDRI